MIGADNGDDTAEGNDRDQLPRPRKRTVKEAPEPLFVLEDFCEQITERLVAITAIVAAQICLEKKKR